MTERDAPTAWRRAQPLLASCDPLRLGETKFFVLTRSSLCLREAGWRGPLRERDDEAAPAGLGSIVDRTFDAVTEVHTIEYRAPGISEFDDLVTVEYVGETGARAFSSEPSVASAFVGARAKVSVSPQAECVELGGSAAFTGAAIGLPSDGVDWEIVDDDGTKGTMSDNGVYEAPNEATSVTLRATAVSDPAVHTDVPVTVGGCRCWWFVNVTGFSGYGSHNVDAFSLDFFTPAGELASINLAGSVGDPVGEVRTLNVGLENAAVPEERERYEVSVAGQFGSIASPTVFVPGDDPATLTVDEAGPDLLEGRIRGGVVVSDGTEDGTPSGLGALFRITDDPEPPGDAEQLFRCTAG